MNNCSLFNKSIKSTAGLYPTIKLDWLKGLLNPLSETNSGIWQPIVIDYSSSQTNFCDPLVQAGLSKFSRFNPCNCNSDEIVSEGFRFYNDTKTANLDCEYCGDYTATWRLYDVQGNTSEDILGANGVFQSTCCGGACDVRFKNDDFLPKIPLLNQTYLSGFYDFKHLQEKFPACSNPGLGIEQFISFSSFSGLNVKNGSFCIDWKLKETIGEIDYDPISSYHLNEYTHIKSKSKSDLISNTCGNFLLMSVSSSGYKEAYDIFDDIGKSKEIPSTEDFVIPYGFDNQTYNNLFIGGKKIASHWKWNYTSGILGWYRYYDQHREQDTRPISGVDLYISQGDVFWATIQGPELTNLSYFDNTLPSSGTSIKECPSGLKVVDGSVFKGIIPTGSECLYISNNLYPTFYSFYEKYIILGETHSGALRLASIMSTSPLYDGYTVDLLHPESTELYSEFNDFKQIELLNKNMLLGTSYGSNRGLNYIQDTKDLINNLYYKYGGYLWVPPNTNAEISLDVSDTSKSLYVDMDFDMVIDKKDIIKQFKNKPIKNSNILPEITSCSSLTETSSKNFSYQQNISIGLGSLSTSLDTSYRHQQLCSSGEFKKSDFALYGNLKFNNKIFSSIPVYSGAYILTDIYSRISTTDVSENFFSTCNDCGANSSFYLVNNAESLCTPPVIDNQGNRDYNSTFCYDKLANFLNNSPPTGQRPRRTLVDGTFYDYRRYKAFAFNPHVDLVAFHENGGMYVNSATFGNTNSIIFDQDPTNQSVSGITINFTTKDIGIKLYSLYIEKLQSSDKDSHICKRFPVDLDNNCKCYGLNLSSYGSRTTLCDNNTSTYRSISLYVPNLSTKNSPKLEYYGGYTTEEVLELFGITVPVVAGNLPDIISKADPENPYSCKKSYSISLLNYVTKKYKLNLENFSTNHADIYVQINENIDYLGRAATLPLDPDEGSETTINYNWKRFLNKVTINNQILYNKQKKILYNSNDFISPVDITLTNPFLEKIIGSAEEIAIPTGDQCSVAPGTSFIVNGVRGDELSTVNLNFTQEPRLQLLTFTLNANTSDSIKIDFSKGYFLPDKGLFNAAGAKPLTGNNLAIDNGKIQYSRLISSMFKENSGSSEEEEDDSFWAPQKLIYGSLNKDSINILNDIDLFSLHKKPRLYLQHQNKWYVANFNNRGGFTRDGKIYIGNPKFFEYLRNPLASKNIGCTIPATPKKLTKLSSKQYQHTQKAIVIDKYTFRIDGALAYTMFPDRGIIFSEYKSLQDHITNITNDNIEQNDILAIRNDDIQLFLYIGMDPTNIENYIYIGNDPSIIKFKSNLEIDYENISSAGYVYDTYKKCDQYLYYWTPITRVASILDAESIQVVGKKLIVKFYDEQNRLVTGDYGGNKRIKIYTEFTTSTEIKADIGTNAALDFGQYDYIWDEIKSTDKHILLSNQAYNTKWGDLLQYDGFLLNNPYLIGNIYKKNFRPSTPYENLLYKQIINDFDSNYTFGSSVKNNLSENQFIDNIKTYDNKYDNLVFFLLQKYNFITDKVWDLDISKFQNFVPVLFYRNQNDPLKLSNPNGGGARFLQHELRPPWLQDSGLINNFYSSSLVNIYDNGLSLNINPDEEDLVIIDSIDKLESAFVPDPAQNFHMETLRLDDPMFWFDRTIKQDTSALPNGGRVLFKSNNMNTFVNRRQIDSHFDSQTIKRPNPFYRQTVYADMDKPKDCGPQDQYATLTNNAPTCTFRSAGSVDLISQFSIGKPKTINYEDLDDNIVGYIGYDAGLYNTIGNKNYITITRTELPTNNPIFPNFNCANSTPLPSFKNKEFLSSYQNFIEENKNATNHSLNVKNMDIHANEMLFRILYGEKQTINKQQLFVDKKPLNKNDLFNYSDTKITPKHIYNEILYNYDKESTKNLSVNGSLNIKGTKEIGDGIVIDIGNVNITLAVIFDATTNSLLLEGNIADKNISVVLYQGKYIQKSLISQHFFADDPAPPSPEPTSDKETIELVSTTSAQTDDIIVADLISDISRYPIEGQQVGMGIDLVRVFRDSVFNPPCHPGTQLNDPFSFGYCRVDDDQNNCDNCDRFEGIDLPFGSPNFTYNFEDCGYQFTLYGHAYRYRYSASGDQPSTDTDDSSNSENVDGSSLHGPDPRKTTDIFGNPIELPPAPGELCPLPTPLHVYSGCMPEVCYYAKPPQGCGSVSVSSGRTVIRKIYIRTLSIDVDPYIPLLCPVDFFSIIYNSSSVSIVVPCSKATLNETTNKIAQVVTNKTYCVPLNINNNCPEIFVSFSNSKYSVSENIESSCNNNCQNNADILIDKEKATYATRDYTAICVVGTFSYGNVNDGMAYPQITAYRPGECCDDFGGCLPPCYCKNGYLRSLCDGSGAPWRICENPKILVWGGNHYNYWGLYSGKGSVVECDNVNVALSAHGPTAVAQASVFENKIKRMFDRTYGTDKSIEAYSGPMHDCQVQPGIPDEDIFEGVIPGSCTLHKYVSTRSVQKARASAGGGAEFGTMTITYVVHYIKYKYRTTPSTQSALSTTLNPDASDEIIEIPPTQFRAPTVKTNNPVEPCRFNSFPDKYKAVNSFGDYISLPSTYVRTAPFYNKGACETSVGCYNTMGTAAEKQTICDNRDWICWSMQDLRNTYNFLNRLNRPGNDSISICDSSYETWK